MYAMPAHVTHALHALEALMTPTHDDALPPLSTHA